MMTPRCVFREDECDEANSGRVACGTLARCVVGLALLAFATSIGFMTSDRIAIADPHANAELEAVGESLFAAEAAFNPNEGGIASFLLSDLLALRVGAELPNFAERTSIDAMAFLDTGAYSFNHGDTNFGEPLAAGALGASFGQAIASSRESAGTPQASFNPFGPSFIGSVPTARPSGGGGPTADLSNVVASAVTFASLGPAVPQQNGEESTSGTDVPRPSPEAKLSACCGFVAKIPIESRPTLIAAARGDVVDLGSHNSVIALTKLSADSLSDVVEALERAGNSTSSRYQPGLASRWNSGDIHSAAHSPYTGAFHTNENLFGRDDVVRFPLAGSKNGGGVVSSAAVAQINSVPEPSTLLLLGAGLIFLAVVQRRRHTRL